MSYDKLLEWMDKKGFMRKVSCALTDKWKLNHEQGSAEECNMQCLLCCSSHLKNMNVRNK